MPQKEEVKHVAFLARLGLTAEELAGQQKELAVILDYIDQLKEVKTKGVEPTAHPLEQTNVMRSDRPESESQKDTAEMLKQAPEKQGDFIKVKQVL